MPASYQLDPASQLVRCTVSGVVTFDGMMVHFKKLQADPAFTFKETARILWDFTASTACDHSVAKFIPEAESWPLSPQVRRALVAAPGTEVQKLLSLWVLHRAVRGDNLVRIFDAMDPALEWLAPPA